MVNSDQLERDLYPYTIDQGFISAWKAYMQDRITKRFNGLGSIPFGDARVHAEVAVIEYMKQIMGISDIVRDAVKRNQPKE